MPRYLFVGLVLFLVSVGQLKLQGGSKINKLDDYKCTLTLKDHNRDTEAPVLLNAFSIHNIKPV